MKIISLTSFLPSPAQNALPRLPIFETVAVYHSTKGKGANKKYSFFHMYCVDVHSNLHHQINVVLVAIMRRRAASFVDRRSPQNVSKENSSPKNSPKSSTMQHHIEEKQEILDINEIQKKLKQLRKMNQKENGLDKSPSNKSHGCTFSSDSVQISETLIESNIRQDDHNFNSTTSVPSSVANSRSSSPVFNNRFSSLRGKKIHLYNLYDNDDDNSSSNNNEKDDDTSALQKILKSRRRTFEFQSLFSKNDKKRNQKDRHKKQQQLKGNGDNNKGKHPNGNESENENGNKQVSDDPAPIPPRISSLQSLNDQQVSSIRNQKIKLKNEKNNSPVSSSLQPPVLAFKLTRL
ncbi:8724_t:CDS:2 [Funneliformis geosporum]|nr:8724_t:CDS:2 [Funneliformis geosporum]